MPCYECVFIARQDIAPNQVDGLTTNLVNLLEQQKGKVVKKENWGLRTLAYPIKKNKKGYYVLLAVDTPPEAIAEIERVMRLNEDIIRFLTVKVDELDLEPSPMMQSRQDRQDRSYDEDDGNEIEAKNSGKNTKTSDSAEQLASA